MLTGIRNQPEVGHRSRCAIDSVPIHWHGRAKQQGLACGARLSRRSEAVSVRKVQRAGGIQKGTAGRDIALIISVISQKKKFEEEVYTRPLPLTSCQEDRLGLDYTVLCLAAYARLWLADLFSVWPHDLGRNIQRESSRVAPMEIRPPGFLAPWLVAGNVVPSAARGMRQ